MHYVLQLSDKTLIQTGPLLHVQSVARGGDKPEVKSVFTTNVFHFILIFQFFSLLKS